MVLALPRTDKTNHRHSFDGRLAGILDHRRNLAFKHGPMSDLPAKKNNQLVLSAIGEDKSGLIDELSRCVLNSGCSILDSRMAILGGNFALLLQVGGNWNNIAKLENQLAGLESALGLTITSRRTSMRLPGKDLLPYGVDVVALDQPGIVHNLARFFSQREINIQEMVTSSYPAAHSGTPMFSVHMNVDIPASAQISVLREEFMEFCDRLNLDAVIEPVKT
jgi:glycine cleavage system transcriptional repressor